ncbi:Ubiquitin-like domain - like 2 [Theobroma cacao]|nr:Ubiquitin-like domain - like 2 [Theobroma cacao]
MDIIFETPEGRAFSIEIGFFDTVLEIKEKVQKYQGIPVARQILVFNGQVLEDERDVEYCVLFQDCRVQLLIADEPQVMEIDEQESSPSKKIQVKVKRPSSDDYVPLEMDEDDTILQLKEKIHEMEPIPTVVNRFVLKSNGEELQDHQSLRDCGFTDDTEINVFVKPTAIRSGTVEINEEESSPSKKIQLKIKIPSSRASVPLEMDVDDTVLRLKEKIHEMEPIPVNRLVLLSNREELQDHRSLRDCELTDNAEIDVFIKPTAIRSGAGSSKRAKKGTKRLKVMVLPWRGTVKIPVEVNPSDNVKELRKELEKLQQRSQINLPVEGYFFIHKQSILDDDKSFRWQDVANGDTIEIFRGRVTNGS